MDAAQVADVTSARFAKAALTFMDDSAPSAQ